MSHMYKQTKKCPNLLIRPPYTAVCGRTSWSTRKSWSQTYWIQKKGLLGKLIAVSDGINCPLSKKSKPFPWLFDLSQTVKACLYPILWSQKIRLSVCLSVCLYVTHVTQSVSLSCRQNSPAHYWVCEFVCSLLFVCQSVSGRSKKITLNWVLYVVLISSNLSTIILICLSLSNNFVLMNLFNLIFVWKSVWGLSK